MGKEQIINILLAVLAVVVSFIGYYFYIKAKATKAAESAIDEAEKEDKTGVEKLNEATDAVMLLIPVILRPILKRDVVKGIVQSAFDKIEAYAKKQVAKKKK